MSRHQTNKKRGIGKAAKGRRTGTGAQKLRVGPVNDRFEREADRTARDVTGTSNSPASIAFANPNASAVQRKPTSTSLASAPGPVSSSAMSLNLSAGAVDSMQGNGRPLPPASRAFFEARFGTDFNSVRIHDNAHAHEVAEGVRAKAFTLGNNVVFGKGQFQPNHAEGERLIAHELTHVVQQREGQVANTIQREVDEGKYFPDRKGAVSRAREIQQNHTKVEIFKRPDGNFQVKFSDELPKPKKFPAVDEGYYYPDKQGAEARARLLRAFGFVVVVFERPDGNFQCRITRLLTQSQQPGLPISTGADAGFAFTGKANAEQRNEGLKQAGFDAEVVQRDDKNWQVEIKSLPTFENKSSTPQAPTPVPLAAKTPADKTPADKTPADKTPAASAPAAAGGPVHKLAVINQADKSKKQLSSSVVQSYRDFVDEVKSLTGQDLGLGFGDTVRPLQQPTAKKRADTVSWHKTGRAVDINQHLKWVIVKDSRGTNMFFKIYLLHKDKNAKASPPEVVKFSKGTDFETEYYGGGNVYKWTFVDVSAIAAKHGWQPIQAQEGWEKNYNKMEWWHFEKRDGNTWYQSIAEIYTEKQIVEGIKSFTKGITLSTKYGARLKRASVRELIDSLARHRNKRQLLPIG